MSSLFVSLLFIMAASRVDVKVVLLGSQSVGKTCLVERYLYGKFNLGVTATVGAAFGAKKITKGAVTINLGIWDTAGAERYEAMSRIYYRQARAAVVCFDLTSSESFGKVKFWVEELFENEPACDVYIVGTKVDLLQEKEREVERNMVENYMKTIHAKGYYETSAKTGDSIDTLFDTIAANAFAKFKEGEIAASNNSNTTFLDNDNPPKKSGCCGS